MATKLNPNATVTTDLGDLFRRGLDEVKAELGTLDEEAQGIVERAIATITRTGVMLVGATAEEASPLLIERNAAIATLANLGEEKASRVAATVDRVVWGAIAAVIGAAVK